jgi:hypothetical protein
MSGIPILSSGLEGIIDTDSTMAANSDNKLPTQKAVKAAIAAALTGGVVQPVNLSFNYATYGTTPRFIGSAKIPAGTYTLTAYVGNKLYNKNGILTVKNGATTIKSVTKMGYPAWTSASTTFTLTIATTLDFYLSGDNSYSYPYIKGVLLS